MITLRETLIRLRCSADGHGLAMPEDAEARIVSLPLGALWDAQRALLLWAPEQQHTVALGELTLQGELRPTRSILSMLADTDVLETASRMRRVERAIVPSASRVEASYGRVPVCAARDLTELLRVARDTDALVEPHRSIIPKSPYTMWSASFGDPPELTGKLRAAMQPVVDAGLGEKPNLRVLLTGPPGCGKTLAARWMYSRWALPSAEKLMEASINYSRAGMLTQDRPIIDSPTFRAPHHSCSEAGIFGNHAKGHMGEIDLARGGVLFLDELPEFRLSVLGRVALKIKQGKLDDVGIVGATNPCPCGYHGHPRRKCRCSEKNIALWECTLDIMRPLFDVEIRLPAFG